MDYIMEDDLYNCAVLYARQIYWEVLYFIAGSNSEPSSLLCQGGKSLNLLYMQGFTPSLSSAAREVVWIIRWSESQIPILGQVIEPQIAPPKASQGVWVRLLLMSKVVKIKLLTMKTSSTSRWLGDDPAQASRPLTLLVSWSIFLSHRRSCQESFLSVM